MTLAHPAASSRWLIFFAIFSRDALGRLLM